MDFKDYIEAEVPGMAGGTATYSLEEIYQAFKERLLAEEKKKEELMAASQLPGYITEEQGRVVWRGEYNAGKKDGRNHKG